MRYDIVMLSCEGSPTLGRQRDDGDLHGAVHQRGRPRVRGALPLRLLHGLQHGDGPGLPAVSQRRQLGQPRDRRQRLALQQRHHRASSRRPCPTARRSPRAWPSSRGSATSALSTRTARSSSPSANARDTALVTSTNVATPWVQTDPTVTPASTQYFSWDMPFNPPVSDAGVPQYCGRAVYSDMHVSGSANDYGGGQRECRCRPVATATSALSPDEDAIEFILFDLSSCIAPRCGRSGLLHQAPRGAAGGFTPTRSASRRSRRTPKTRESLARYPPSFARFTASLARLGRTIQRKEPSLARPGRTIQRKEPSLARLGRTIQRKEPSLARPGRTIQRKEPSLARPGRTIQREEPSLARLGRAIQREEPSLARLGRAIRRKGLGHGTR
jgi:hypothetical protein